MNIKHLFTPLLLGTCLLGTSVQMALADAQAAKRWIETEFSDSTLTPEQQMQEMRW
ncbi:MAG: glycerol transport system substrate-binding protein, partial [Glaciecola sp.]